MTFRTRVLGLEGRCLGLGFEDAEIEAAPEAEELVQSVQESTELQSEVSSDLATVERLEQQAAGLEDIAAINEQLVAEASEGELALTEVATDLAAVGTDIQGAEEMIPALESYQGRRISMEGIKQVAKDIWAAIKAFMKRIWEKIVKFWRKITDQVPGVVKAAKKLQQRAEATQGKTLKDKADKIELSSSEGRALSLGNTKIAGNATITTGLAALNEVCADILGNYATTVKEAGEAIASKVSAFDLDKPEESLSEITTAAAAAVGKKNIPSIKHKVTGDKRFSADLNVYRSEPLPGRVAVFHEIVNKQDLKASPLGNAQIVRSNSVTVARLEEKEKEFTGDFKISTQTASEVSAHCDAIIDIMEVLKKFQEKTRRDLETGNDKVTRACDQISKTPDDETPANALKHYQSALQYGGTYVKWCASPFMSLLSHTLATCRHVISVGNKSLSQYKS